MPTTATACARAAPPPVPPRASSGDVSGKLPLLLDDGRQYIYGVGLLSRVIGGTTYYYLTDGLGSVLAIVNNSGALQQNYAYDVFGAVTQQSGSLGSEQQFAGQQTDPDGLQYLRARYYDPATGRFLSRDSWSNDDKTVFHPYVYVNNNPSTGLDPTGHNGPDCEDDDCGDSGNGGDMAPLPTTPEGADPPVLPPDLSIGYLLWQELSRGVQLTLGPQLTTD